MASRIARDDWASVESAPAKRVALCMRVERAEEEEGVTTRTILGLPGRFAQGEPRSSAPRVERKRDGTCAFAGEVAQSRGWSGHLRRSLLASRTGPAGATAAGPIPRDTEEP